MPWCETCNQFMFYPESHQCPPVFLCEPANETYGSGYDFEVHARSPESAAEKFCEQWDSGGDYDIIRAGSFEVKVTDPRDGNVTLWEIAAESVPQYTAYPKEPAQVGTHPKGGDAKQAPGASLSDAVGEADAPIPSPDNPPSTIQGETQ